MDAPPGEGGGEAEAGTKVMGAIVGGYLACVVCCTGCCVVGSALLLWTGAACLSQSAGECGRAGAYAMLLFGALPPLMPEAEGVSGADTLDEVDAAVQPQG